MFTTSASACVCSALRSCPVICAALWAGAVGRHLHSNSFSYLCSHRRLDTASRHENWISSEQRKIKNSVRMHAHRRWAPLSLGAPVSALTRRFQLSKLVRARERRRVCRLLLRRRWRWPQLFTPTFYGCSWISSDCVSGVWLATCWR